MLTRNITVSVKDAGQMFSDALHLETEYYFLNTSTENTINTEYMRWVWQGSLYIFSDSLLLALGRVTKHPRLLSSVVSACCPGLVMKTSLSFPQKIPVWRINDMLISGHTEKGRPMSSVRLKFTWTQAWVQDWDHARAGSIRILPRRDLWRLRERSTVWILFCKMCVWSLVAV